MDKKHSRKLKVGTENKIKVSKCRVESDFSYYLNRLAELLSESFRNYKSR